MKENFFTYSPELEKTAEKALELCKEKFKETDEIAEYNSQKVLKAFTDNKIGENHLKGSNGYGYNDEGRDKLDRVFAQSFGAEDALVRHNFINGTHAITTALFGILRPGDKIVSVTGEPYDTLREVIYGENNGSLKDFGVEFCCIPLCKDGSPDFAAITKGVKGCRAAYIQRSRGYSLRPSYNVSVIEEICGAIRKGNGECAIIVDNCYGEFTERTEPVSVGADLIIGSLIKNPGGGIAETGGYIAGKKELVELCSYRLTSPGTGREAGASLNQLRGMYLGFFRAPETTASAIKTAVFASALFELLGFETFPKYNEKRADIITAIKLGGEKQLIEFCKGIQKGSPVDSFLSPEPWDMPGYENKVIMAAGAFTLGSSIELSADAPLREPYAVWLQGGISFPYGKTGVMIAAQSLIEKGFIKF